MPSPRDDARPRRSPARSGRRGSDDREGRSTPWPRSRATRFLPPEAGASPWTTAAVEIGLGQTISQPFMVARDDPRAGDDRHPSASWRSAPAAATRRRSSPTWPREVFTVERHRDPLAPRPGDPRRPRPGQRPLPNRRRHARLARAGPLRPDPRHRRGPRVAARLFDQLAEGGILVAPIGDDRMQELTVIRKVEGSQPVSPDRVFSCHFREVDRRGRLGGRTLTEGRPVAGRHPSILRRRLTISMAARAESTPLFPAFNPERLRACSTVSVVRTPKITGNARAQAQPGVHPPAACPATWS